jgi:hypothetical protein
MPDIEGAERTVKMTADRLYEVVARGIRATRDTDLGGRI